MQQVSQIVHQVLPLLRHRGRLVCSWEYLHSKLLHYITSIDKTFLRIVSSRDFLQGISWRAEGYLPETVFLSSVSCCWCEIVSIVGITPMSRFFVYQRMKPFVTDVQRGMGMRSQTTSGPCCLCNATKVPGNNLICSIM